MKTNGQPQETVLRIKGFIIPDPTRLGKHIGELKVNRTEFNFGNILDTESKRDSILVKNSSSEKMELVFEWESEEIENFKIEMPDNELESGEESYIYGYLEGSEQGEYGFNRLRFRFNDRLHPEKTRGGLSVTYSQNEDFGSWSAEKKSQAAVIKLQRSVYDFGERQQGELIDCEFSYSNEGKSDLIIRDVRKTSFVEVKEIDRVVSPGGSGRLILEVDTARSSGNFIRYITITTNSPTRVKNKLTIRGKIVDK